MKDKDDAQNEKWRERMIKIVGGTSHAIKPIKVAIAENMTWSKAEPLLREFVIDTEMATGDFTLRPSKQINKSQYTLLYIRPDSCKYREFTLADRSHDELEFSMFIGDYPGGPNYSGDWLVP